MESNNNNDDYESLWNPGCRDERGYLACVGDCKLCLEHSRKVLHKRYLMWEQKLLEDMGRVKPRLPRVEPVNIPNYESCYELTITSLSEDPKDLLQSFDTIVNSKMVSCIGYDRCIELTHNGYPHIHAAIYSSKKYLDAKKICALSKTRTSLSRVRNLDNFFNYINKDRDNQSTISYCLKHSVEQFSSMR